jgi:hypothetical protein
MKLLFALVLTSLLCAANCLGIFYLEWEGSMECGGTASINEYDAAKCIPDADGKSSMVRTCLGDSTIREDNYKCSDCSCVVDWTRNGTTGKCLKSPGESSFMNICGNLVHASAAVPK